METLPAIKDRTDLEWINGIETLCQSALSRTVADLSDYEAASVLAKSIKATLKNVKELQDSYIKPLKLKTLEVQCYFSPHIDGLLNAEKHLKQIRMDYDAEQQRKRDEEQKRLEALYREQARKEAEAAAMAAIRAGDESKAETILELAEVAPVAVPQLKPIKPLAGTGLSYKDNWKWDCPQPELVPPKYRKWVLDDAKITAEVKEKKDLCDIPGILVRNDRIPTQRR